MFRYVATILDVNLWRKKYEVNEYVKTPLTSPPPPPSPPSPSPYSPLPYL